MGTDIDSLLNNPIGQPMATIFFNSFGQKGTLAVWAIVVVVQSVHIHLELRKTLKSTFLSCVMLQVHDGLVYVTRILSAVLRFCA